MGKSRISTDSWIVKNPICHRGLWSNVKEDGVPENSIKAYQLASQLKRPIEIDLYMTKDGEIVSYHDKYLERMTGEKDFVYNKTLEELKRLRLDGTEYSIPTFDEVLEIAEGKSPLLIELKDQPDDSYVEKVVERLKSYKGEFAIQSFNPKYINKVRKLAPQFIRGILATEIPWDNPLFTRWVLKKMPFNFHIKPDFISYSQSGFPLKNRKTKNKVVLAWTITSQEEEKNAYQYADNIIYENFVPEKYK